MRPVNLKLRASASPRLDRVAKAMSDTECAKKMSAAGRPNCLRQCKMESLSSPADLHDTPHQRQRCGNAGQWSGGGKLSSRVMGRPSSTSSFPPPPPALGNRQRRDFHIPTAPATVLTISIKKTKPSLRPSCAPAGAHHERRFLSLLATPCFRIILYWNQMSISVSFFDWKMLRSRLSSESQLQGHLNHARPRSRRHLAIGRRGDGLRKRRSQTADD